MRRLTSERRYTKCGTTSDLISVLRSYFDSYAIHEFRITGLLRTFPKAYKKGPLGRYGVRGPSSPLVQMGPKGERERPLRVGLPVVLEAGLSLSPFGPICTRGELGPLTPYLPSGPFL